MSDAGPPTDPTGLSPATTGSTAVPSLGHRQGDRVGHFRLIEPLGQGGFGIVWRAEQTEPVHRQVAVKLIKPGMDSKSVLARFEAERQALAMMDHPCVARVFDGGATERGLPYFAMELVRGLPITDHCDRHRLGIQERIDLFIRVCHAVQHAHSKGVIHRDLKPSNILVEYADGLSTPKVIDFGVAKALNQRLTEATLFTEQGQLIGTPEYMSPEQAEMTAQDVDTRSDVYSLGVILYELLTGSRPFESETLRRAGYAEIQRIIREVDPPKPSTRLHSLAAPGHDPRTAERIAGARRTQIGSLTNTLRRDLDWVVVRCIEKDRERRYQTASDLAADLKHYLNDEPVSAGPPTVKYRVAKFVRRHRGAAAAALAVFSTLVLGVIGTSGGLVWALQKQSETNEQRVAAVEARAEAQAITEFLVDDLLGAAQPSAEPGRGRNTTVLEVLDDARQTLLAEASTDGRLADQPAVQRRIAWTLGQTYSQLAAHTPAREMLEFARKLAPREELPDEWVGVTLDLALVYEDWGRYVESEREARSAYEFSAEAFGPDHLWTLESQSILALALYDQDRFAEAEALYRDELERRRALPEYHETDEQSTLNNLALVLADTGRTEEAIQLLERDLEISRRAGDHELDTLTTANNLALLYDEAGQSELALARLRDIEAQSREHLGPQHSDTLLAIWNRAGLERALGHDEIAQPLLEEVVEGHAAVFGDEDPYTVLSAVSLIECLIDNDDQEGAGAVLERFDHTAPSLLGRGDADGLDAAGALADARWTLGNPDDALELSSRVLTLRRSLFGDEHTGTLAESIRHARLLLEADKPAEALRALPGPEIAATPTSIPDSWVALRLLEARSEALCDAERYERAADLLDEAITDLTSDDTDTETAAEAMLLLAGVYDRWHESAPGAGHAGRAEEWRESADQLDPAPSHPGG